MKHQFLRTAANLTIPLLSALILLSGLILALGAQSVQADDATWNLTPASGDWNTATNWTPNTVPTDSDIATFKASNITDIPLSKDSGILEMVFNPGANSFTFTADSCHGLTLNSVGIVNNSGVTQYFISESASVNTCLPDGATTGSPTIPTFGKLIFTDGATAGSQTIFTARDGGDIWFENSASAGEGVFVNKASLTSLGAGGRTTFFSNATAGNATFISEGGQTDGRAGGNTSFSGTTHAADATLIAEGGINGGGGGHIALTFSAAGERARVQLFGNGTLDIYGNKTPVSVGSIEGDGVVSLGKTLSVGTNGLSTTFSGLIKNYFSDSGSLAKTGTGELTLAGGESTYTGGTTLSEGTLIVTNKTGSATGTGEVSVSGGTLGGSGKIGGAVIIGKGSGTGAFLAPAHGGDAQLTLTIQSSLTFNSDATLTYTFQASQKRSKVDKVVANGVTINSGAIFNLIGTAIGTLTPGTVLTVIKNTATTPISGTFSNLPDGAIINVNRNNLEASYTGGDGNDLTLTVVP